MGSDALNLSDTGNLVIERLVLTVSVCFSGVSAFVVRCRQSCGGASSSAAATAPAASTKGRLGLRVLEGDLASGLLLRQVNLEAFLARFGGGSPALMFVRSGLGPGSFAGTTVCFALPRFGQVRIGLPLIVTGEELDSIGLCLSKQCNG